MADTVTRLTACFSVVFPTLGPSDTPRAAQASVAGWDSLASVILVAVIEEEFDVRISDEEFEEMTSFARVLDLIEAKVARG